MFALCGGFNLGEYRQPKVSWKRLHVFYSSNACASRAGSLRPSGVVALDFVNMIAAEATASAAVVGMVINTSPCCHQMMLHAAERAEMRMRHADSQLKDAAAIAAKREAFVVYCLVQACVLRSGMNVSTGFTTCPILKQPEWC